MEGNTFEIYMELQEAEKKFNRACEQVILLNDKLQFLEKRLDKATQEDQKSFRYNLRLKMATVEGIRNCYYNYASEKAGEIAQLRYELSGDDTDVSEDEMHTSDDDDYYEDEPMDS